MSTIQNTVLALTHSLNLPPHKRPRSLIEWLLSHQSDDAFLSNISQKLTTREEQVLWLYIIQQDDFELAYLLGIQPQSVRNHLAEIKDKLGICSRPGLVSRALLALVRESETKKNL